MNQRTLIIAVALVLTVTLPYWISISMIIDFFPAQLMFAVFAYALEVTLMVALIMAVLENRLSLMIAGGMIAFVLGSAPGVNLMPLTIFFPLWLKALAPAMVIGIMMRRGSKVGLAFMAGGIVMAVAVLLMVPQSDHLITREIDQMNTSVEKMITGSVPPGSADTESVNQLVDSWINLMRVVVRLLPGMLIMSGIGQLFVAFLFTEWYYTRKDSFFPGFGPFTYWKLPEKLLYLLAAIALVRLATEGDIQRYADNLLFIVFTCYAVTGLSLIESLLRRLRLPMVVRIIFYIGLVLMSVPGLIVTAVAGVFDSYFDFRKIRAHTLG